MSMKAQRNPDEDRAPSPRRGETRWIETGLDRVVLPKAMLRMAPCLAVLAIITAAGCRPPVVIHRSLTTQALRTCDANQRLRVEREAATEKAARQQGESAIRESIASRGGCGALIVNDGAGAMLDGGFRYTANYQVCSCQK